MRSGQPAASMGDDELAQIRPARRRGDDATTDATRVELSPEGDVVVRLLWRSPLAPALFNLDHPARYVHWHFFQMSVANVVVIVLMIVVFVAAILIPFPGRGRRA
jgi:hypothetical protein